MSEPQHPTPFGSHSGNRSGGQYDGQAGAEGAASNASQAGPLDSIQAVGARLAQLRQAKAWSIDDVSARLKVSPTKLLALEAGDISHLPDRTFAAGIVRSYAKILGADPAPFTQAFRRDGGEIEHNLKVPASAGGGLPRGRVSVPLGNSSSRKRSWMWGVLAIIVVLAALVTWHTGGESSNWLARRKRPRAWACRRRRHRRRTNRRAHRPRRRPTKQRPRTPAKHRCPKWRARPASSRCRVRSARTRCRLRHRRCRRCRARARRLPRTLHRLRRPRRLWRRRPRLPSRAAARARSS